MIETSSYHTRLAAIPTEIYAYNFPRWKHPVVRQCFLTRKVIFIKKGGELPQEGWLALWGMAIPPAGLRAGVRIVRMEDGFLRSVGLGADLIRPMSWVVDTKGIYYNATCASDLEDILSTHSFSEALLLRATQLQARLIATGLTKYNNGCATWQRPNTEKLVILVPGQVESDASITFGATGIKSNMGLLQEVRKHHKDAYIIYKPHPDVTARLRLEGKDEKDAHQWCDEVITDVTMGALLGEVDHVHVLTSLAGFEALLRGKKVTCWGQPFYSGWGLTHDMASVPRARTLTIEQLMAGVLIEYPLYLSRDGKHLISPEEALESLLLWRTKTKGRNPWWQNIYRIFLRYFAGVR